MPRALLALLVSTLGGGYTVPSCGQRPTRNQIVPAVPPDDRRELPSHCSFPDIRGGNRSINQGAVLRGAQSPPDRGGGHLFSNGTAQRCLLSNRRGLGAGNITRGAYRRCDRIGQARAVLSLLERRAPLRIAGFLFCGKWTGDKQFPPSRWSDRLPTDCCTSVSGMPQHFVHT